MISSVTILYAFVITAALSAPILINIFHIRQRIHLTESFMYALEKCLKRELNSLKDESSFLRHDILKIKETLKKKYRKRGSYKTKKKKLASIVKEVDGESSSVELSATGLSDPYN